jgi:hypothetical protein
MTGRDLIVSSAARLKTMARRDASAAAGLFDPVGNEDVGFALHLTVAI